MWEPSATCSCLFLIALESELANNLLDEGGKEQEAQGITELKAGVPIFRMLKEENFGGLFLKTLRSFEKSLMRARGLWNLLCQVRGLRPSMAAALCFLGQPQIHGSEPWFCAA